MLLRKPLPSWIGVSLFGIAVSMMPLAGPLWRQPTAPHTMTELTARLSRGTPLHIVRQFPDRPEGPTWICTRPMSHEELWGMIRTPERVKASQWQGIVFCERLRPEWVADMEEEFIHTVWGEYGMLLEPFVLFGDPDLLQRIHAVILDGEGVQKNFEKNSD